MYKGATVSLVGVAPFIALRMASYDMLSTKFKKHTNNAVLANGGAGMLVGMMAVSVCYPQDVVRRRI